MTRKKDISLFFVAAFFTILLTACSAEQLYTGPAKEPLTDPADISTGLPKVFVTTPEGQEITEKGVWLEGVQMTVCDADGKLDYQGTLSIKGRGNSTWGFPKKPYALKLDKKQEVLGMPKHKRWVLLANWIDRTMMRNDVAFEIARQMPALQYTPRGCFVELFLNGRHQGNYYLCEQIKVDKNRLDITELDESTQDGLGFTGGFLMEIDAHFDEEFRFMSKQANMPWQCKDPDKVNDLQFEYIHRYVDEMEDALYDEKRFANRDFIHYMDLETFAEWWIVHELTMNSEPQYPYSCLMHKDIDTPEYMSKMKAGPVWDFDFNTFRPEYAHQFTNYSHVYYPRLFQDATFRRIMKERWAAVKTAGLLKHISEYIDHNEKLLLQSDRLNTALWPITKNINGDVYIGFHDAVQRLKAAFTAKYFWLDNAINNL